MWVFSGVSLLLYNIIAIPTKLSFSFCPTPFPLSLKFLFQGIGTLKWCPQRVHSWGNGEPDVSRRSALQRCDQLHPPAVVLPSADHPVHIFPVAGVRSLCFGRIGSHGDNVARQWSDSHHRQKIPGQQQWRQKMQAHEGVIRPEYNEL